MFKLCTRMPARPARVNCAFLLAVAHAACASSLAAQELEPRAYSPAPVGSTFLVVAAVRSAGDVLFDVTLPIDDANATLLAVTVGAGYTFGVLGRQASVLGAVPFAHARVEASAGDEVRTASQTGIADPRAKLSVNLVGGPALTAREFAQRSPGSILGISLTVAPPLGTYDTARRANLGANRWSFKPEIGYSWPLNRWTFEGYAGAWLFTRNDEFFPGTVVREQDPITAVQAHVGYTFRPRLWAAVDATWYTGGGTTTDGIERGDLQRNSRVGLTMSLPMGRQYSIKLAYSVGATTRTGTDFNTFSVGWQAAWAGR